MQWTHSRVLGPLPGPRIHKTCCRLALPRDLPPSGGGVGNARGPARKFCEGCIESEPPPHGSIGSRHANVGRGRTELSSEELERARRTRASHLVRPFDSKTASGDPLATDTVHDVDPVTKELVESEQPMPQFLCFVMLRTILTKPCVGVVKPGRSQAVHPCEILRAETVPGIRPLLQLPIAGKKRL